MPNGLSNPDRVDWGSWGGRFGPAEKAGVRGMTESGRLVAEPSYDPYYMYSDAPEGGSSINRWSTAIHNDFAARMDWSITGTFSGANHHRETASVQVPAGAGGKNLHIVLQLRDNGAPNLYSYRRVVINVR
ncbi:hypothetical protein ACPFP2_00735 [Micromonospora citrea]|uniref:hypothetical protein n=1 Tax=Micromonospora citrea TaxID=47855 RepID=UPI003C360C71